MFGGFPKLFDRSFFIGYFVPAFLLFIGEGTNLLVFGYIDKKFTDILADKSTLGAVLSVVIIWLLSILLMTFNRPVIRLLEGYGDSNPFRIFLPLRQSEFKSRAEPHLRRLQRVLDARRRGIPEAEEFSELSVYNAARDFPEALGLVLPTRLGNVMRAYERYSDVVYSIEAIALWPRLFMIIPEETRDRIRESEGLFNFCVNMLLSSILTLGTSGVMLVVSFCGTGYSGLTQAVSWPIILVLIFGTFFAWYSWWVLPDAARQRGEQVKSTFDVFRGKLAEALGLELPATEAEEQRMWRLVSRRMLLRVAEDRLPDSKGTLDAFRKREEAISQKEATISRRRKVSEIDSKKEEMK